MTIDLTETQHSLSHILGIGEEHPAWHSSFPNKERECPFCETLDCLIAYMKGAPMTDTPSILNDDSELDRKLFDVLKELQVGTLKNYDKARDDGSELAASLLPDAWSMRLDEAKASLKAFIHQRDEARDLQSRIDELCHTDGLFNCFKTTEMPVMKRIGELRAQLAKLTEDKPHA